MSTFQAREYDLKYYGHSLRVMAVDIDGQRLSDTFAPFLASMEALTSRICEECYGGGDGTMASCSPADILVRRHGETIYWFASDFEFALPLLEDASLDHVWSFPRLEYEQQLRGNTSSLPDFSDADARLILGRATICPYQLGLYVTPDFDDDPQGWGLLKSIDQLIHSNDLTISVAPDHSAAINIGIESDGLPEVRFEVGISKDRGVIRFNSNPYFPRWVTSATINEFAQTLVSELESKVPDNLSG